MTVVDVDEIITDIFPRKIIHSSQDEAKSAISELIAFWEYLNREYRLPEADAILDYLKSSKPGDFEAIMNDPSNFGMAKAFFTAGQSAGFDMTSDEEANEFMQLYNESLETKNRIMPGEISAPSRNRIMPGEVSAPSSQIKKDKAKAKRIRKAAKAARKRGKKKKRK